MEPRLRYAHQQFLSAVQALATHEGSLRERIVDASEYLDQLVREDFSGRLKERFVLLEKVLSGRERMRKAARIETNTVRQAMRTASDEQVAEIADMIFCLFLTLHRHRFTEGEIA